MKRSAIVYELHWGKWKKTSDEMVNPIPISWNGSINIGERVDAVMLAQREALH